MRIVSGMAKHLVDALEQPFRDGVFKNFGFLMHFRPVELHDLHKKSFDQPMAPHDIQGLSPSFGTKRNAVARPIIDPALLLKMPHHGGDGAGCQAQFLGNSADGDAVKLSVRATLFLKVQDAFEIVFDGGSGHTDRATLPFDDSLCREATSMQRDKGNEKARRNREKTNETMKQKERKILAYASAIHSQKDLDLPIFLRFYRVVMLSNRHLSLVVGFLAFSSILAQAGIPIASTEPSSKSVPPPESLVADEELPFEVSLTAAWDSRYVTEGRDNLDGDSLFGTTFELGYAGFVVGAWYADSPESSYTELNLFAEYGFELGGFEFYAGYTHLRFLDDNEFDNEVGAGVSYGELPGGIVPAIDWYYSFEAEGWFAEASLSRDFEIGESFVLSPAVVFGFNQGYIADGHDGANHVAVLLSAAYALTENIEIGGYVAYTWGIDADPVSSPDDELLEDFFYGGVALTLAF